MSQRNNPPRSREWTLTYLPVSVATNLDDSIQVLLNCIQFTSNPKRTLRTRKFLKKRAIMDRKCHQHWKRLELWYSFRLGEKRDLDRNKLSQHFSLLELLQSTTLKTQFRTTLLWANPSEPPAKRSLEVAHSSREKNCTVSSPPRPEDRTKPGWFSVPTRWCVPRGSHRALAGS